MAIASPYYPPRSRWYRPFQDWWHRLTRMAPTVRLLLDGLEFPLSLRDTVLSLAVPGFVFRACGHDRAGRGAMVGLVAGWLVFFAWLGSYAANLAFSLLLSLHVVSVSFLLVRMHPRMNLIFRILVTLCLFTALLAMYGYFRGQLSDYFLPLRVDGRVVVVKPSSGTKVHRGEWVAHRIGTDSQIFQTARFQGALRISDGFGLNRIIAVPGDVIRFTGNMLQVNGQAFPREKFMPTSGEIVLLEKQWFAWPQFAIKNNGVPKTEIAKAMLAHAIITEDQLLGKPFKRWFGRRQILP